MPVTCWAFQCEAGVWRRLPWKRYEAFSKGQVPLDEPAGSELKCATVILQTRKRLPVKVVELTFNRHITTAGGLVDEEHSHEVLVQAMNLMECQPAKPPSEMGEKVVDFVSVAARRAYQRLAHWRPSQDEQRALAILLRALDVPLGVEDQKRRLLRQANGRINQQFAISIRQQAHVEEKISGSAMIMVDYECTYRGTVGPFPVSVNQAGVLDVDEVDDDVFKVSNKTFHSPKRVKENTLFYARIAASLLNLQEPILWTRFTNLPAIAKVLAAPPPGG